MSKAATAYLATQVTTTTQGQLLIMLYDAGIKFLKQAREYMIAKDYAKKGILISRAMDIITELASSLNKDKGGQIAENLQSLYTFCNIQLAQANMKMDHKKLDDVIDILSNIRNAYAEILPKVEGDASLAAQMAAKQVGMAASSAAAATPKAKPTAAPKPMITPGQPPVSMVPTAKPAASKPPAGFARSRAASAYGNNS